MNKDIMIGKGFLVNLILLLKAIVASNYIVFMVLLGIGILSLLNCKGHSTSSDLKKGTTSHETIKESEIWFLAKRNMDKNSIENYIKEFPNGIYRDQAEEMLDLLEKKELRRKEYDKLQTPFEAAEHIAEHMVFIHGGIFLMGVTPEKIYGWDSIEMPMRKVKLNNYFISRFEITQKLWYLIMGDNPSHFQDCGHCPVENVNWFDAQKFITKLNQLTGYSYRLPTEAEWEYAARGGQNHKFSGTDRLSEAGWFDENSNKRTHTVGIKSPNSFGLYDMSGNVWEWCSDWYGDYTSEAETNPTALKAGETIVFRGGSWFNRSGNCRITYRAHNKPEFRSYALGFRLAANEFGMDR